MDEIIDLYAASRLLSLDNDPATRTPTVEVAHEAILREWERLRTWLNASREDIRQQRIVAQAAEAWHTNKRDTSYLLSGTRLEQVEKWHDLTELALTPLEHEFIDSSITERTTQQKSESERQVREIRLERRSRNFLRGLVAVFAIAALIAIGLSIFAFNQTMLAQENSEYASSIALAAAASNAQSLNNPDQAIALAVAANTISENPPAYAQSILYDLAFKPATRRDFDLDPWGIGVASDGNTIAYLLPEYQGVAVFNINSNEILAEWAVPVLEGKIGCIANVSTDNETLYLSTWEENFSSGQLIAFELMTGREIQRYSAGAEGTIPDCKIFFSADGQILISTASRLHNSELVFDAVVTWDTATGEIIRRFQPDTINLDNSIAIGHSLSNDAQKLLIAYNTGQVMMWDVNTGQRIGTYGDMRTRVSSESQVFPVYTPYGIVVNVRDQGESYSTIVTMWDEGNGELLNEVTLESPFTGLGLSPDGHTLQLGLMSAQSILLDLSTWQMVELYGHQGNAGDAYFLPNGQLLSTIYGGSDIRLWNLENGAERQRFQGMTGFLTGIAISPDGNILAAQQYLEGDEVPLVLWDLETGEMLRTLTSNEANLRSLAFSPDGRYLVSSSNHGDVHALVSCNQAYSELRLFNVATGELIWEVEKEAGTFYSGLAFTPDGSKILTIDWNCDHLVTVRSAETGEILETWSGHQAPIYSISTSPDGKWIASGAQDRTAILWDAATGTVVHTLEHHARLVTTTIFSPDSRILLTADVDSLIHLWDVESGQEIRQLSGHSGFIMFVEFSPDGRYIVSSSGSDGNIFVWDLTAGEIIRRINQPLISPVGSVVAFNHDGQSIFYADENNVIHEVDLMLNEGELLQWVMDNRHVRELTCAERELYRIEPLCESE